MKEWPLSSKYANQSLLDRRVLCDISSMRSLIVATVTILLLPLGSLAAHAALEQAARRIRLRDPEAAPKLAAVNGNVKRTKKKVAAAPKPTPKATNRQSGRTRPRRRTRSKAVVQKKA